jgi:glutamate carboxypeptidase
MSTIDVDAIAKDIARWAAVESPTYDVAAVNRMMDLGAKDLAALGLTVERRAGTLGFGDIVFGRIAGQEPGPGVLILAHVDTVHEVGTLAGPLPIRREGDRLYGPGVTDMKGGTVMTLHMLGRFLSECGGKPKRSITVMLIPDEEVGSPSSRLAIEAEGRAHAHVLVPEPGLDHTLTVGRHAILRYNVTVLGKPSHAGAAIRRGVSAIRAMARLIETVEDWSDFERGQTFAVGRVHAGTWVNVVPVRCTAEVLCVAALPEDVGDIDRRLRTLLPPFPGTSIEVEAGPVRPLFTADERTMALYARAKAIADRHGIPIDHRQAGGGSDGNFTGALGTPTLDGLGVIGGGIHTKEEYCDIKSIAPKATLMAGLLTELAG